MVLGIGGEDVQSLLDRTAKEHGPSHRGDHEHTLDDLTVQLAMRGKLTPENMAAGALHLAADEAWSSMWASIPMRSEVKEPLKRMASSFMVAAMTPRRRRRR